MDLEAVPQEKEEKEKEEEEELGPWRTKGQESWG